MFQLSLQLEAGELSARISYAVGSLYSAGMLNTLNFRHPIPITYVGQCFRHPIPLTSSEAMRRDLISSEPGPVSPCLTVACPVLSCPVLSCPIPLCHCLLSPVLSCLLSCPASYPVLSPVLSCLLSCPVLSHLIVSLSPMLSCPALCSVLSPVSCPVLSCLLFCPVLSPVLSCLLSCPVSCPVLSCPTSLCHCRPCCPVLPYVLSCLLSCPVLSCLIPSHCPTVAAAIDHLSAVSPGISGRVITPPVRYIVFSVRRARRRR